MGSVTFLRPASSCFVAAAALITAVVLLLPVPGRAAEPLRQHRPVTLKTGDGATINPLAGENADKPYSPRETCGKCHPYETIVEGYHFQQGRTQISDEFDSRCPWVLSPGMYGGY